MKSNIYYLSSSLGSLCSHRTVILNHKKSVISSTRPRVVFFPAEVNSRACQIAADEGTRFFSEFDDPDAIAGMGSMGLEILEQVPDVEAIVVPCGIVEEIES